MSVLLLFFILNCLESVYSSSINAFMFVFSVAGSSVLIIFFIYFYFGEFLFMVFILFLICINICLFYFLVCSEVSKHFGFSVILFLWCLGLFSLFLYKMFFMSQVFFILSYFSMGDLTVSDILPYKEYIVDFYLICFWCLWVKWFSKLFVSLWNYISDLFKSVSWLESKLESLKLFYMKYFFYLNQVLSWAGFLFYCLYWLVVFFSSLVYLSLFYYEVYVYTYPNWGLMSLSLSYFAFVFYFPVFDIELFTYWDFFYVMVYFFMFWVIMTFILCNLFLSFQVLPSFKKGLFVKDVESGSLDKMDKFMYEVNFLSVLFFWFGLFPVPMFAFYLLNGHYLAKLQYFFYLFDMEVLKSFKMDLKSCYFSGLISGFSSFLGIFGPMLTNWVVMSSCFIKPISWFWEMFALFIRIQSTFSMGLFTNKLDMSHWFSSNEYGWVGIFISILVLAFFLCLFNLLIFYIWYKVFYFFWLCLVEGIFWLPTKEESEMILEVISKK